MYLTKEQILAVDDLQAEDVQVPEWGGTVRVRCMTGVERDAFERSNIGEDGKQDISNFRAKLVARSIVDEHGNRLFSDADIEALGRKSIKALGRCFDVAMRLSAVTDDAVEELEKN